MDEEQRLEKLKKVLRALVVSSPTQMDVRELLRDYQQMEGAPLPYREFGCRSPQRFLQERCQDCFLGSPGNPTLVLIVNDNIRHIDEHVRNQRRPRRSTSRLRRSRRFRVTAYPKTNSWRGQSEPLEARPPPSQMTSRHQIYCSFNATRVNLTRQPAGQPQGDDNCPPAPAKVLRTCAERHARGLMHPHMLPILTHRRLALPVLDTPRDIPSAHHLYRPIRQNVYAILYNMHHHRFMARKAREEGTATAWSNERPCTVQVSECVNPGESAEPVPGVVLDWPVPTVQRLWFGTGPDDKSRRMRAFLSCMRSCAPLMRATSYVPQHLLILATVLRFIMSSQIQILRRPELDAFLATAFSSDLMNALHLQEMNVNDISSRAVQLGALAMAGADAALLANDACGAPVPRLVAERGLNVDTKLLQRNLYRANHCKNLAQLCDNHSDTVVKVKRMRKAILEGLEVEFAMPPLLVARASTGAGGRPGSERGRGARLETAGVVVGQRGSGDPAHSPQDADVFPADCMHRMDSIPAQGCAGLRPGDRLGVAVGEVYSPSHFWFIRLGDQYNIAMEDLMDEMNEYYKHGEGAERVLAPGAVRVGQCCASAHEGHWRRSVVVRALDTDTDTVKVRHVDYGTVERVPAGRLRPLLRRWAALPAQAARARLAGLRPWGRRWPPAAADAFLQQVRDKHLVACVVSADPEEDAVEVQLVDTTTADDVWIAAELVRQGHADTRPPSALTTESHLLPRFEALESGATPGHAELREYLRHGIVLECVAEYRQHVLPPLPPAQSPLPAAPPSLPRAQPSLPRAQPPLPAAPASLPAIPQPLPPAEPLLLAAPLPAQPSQRAAVSSLPAGQRSLPSAQPPLPTAQPPLPTAAQPPLPPTPQSLPAAQPSLPAAPPSLPVAKPPAQPPLPAAPMLTRVPLPSAPAPPARSDRAVQTSPPPSPPSLIDLGWG